jgi:hypothetical protein
MFANANVIYRTRFRDGVSAVDRTLGGSVLANASSDHQQQPDSDHSSGIDDVKKKGLKKSGVNFNFLPQKGNDVQSLRI